MEMSGSFAQKYYKDENKDMFKSLTNKKRRQSIKWDAGTRSKLLAAVFGSSNQSIQP